MRRRGIMQVGIAALATGLAAAGPPPKEVSVTVTIENLAPAGGNYLTPVWVGFHNGTFDPFDTGAAAPMQIERIAEDGNSMPLSMAFDMAGGGAQATIVSDTGIPPLAPGETATMTFTLDGRNPASRYFSYASMVIPSNDAFIANDDPHAHKVFNNGGHLLGADFIVYGVHDAGTELNDEAPANTAFFGQMMPNTGQTEGTVVHDHVGFKLPGNGGILDDPMFANADFTGYAVARITVAEGG